MKKRRALLLTLLALLLVVGIPAGFFVREYRHERLNRELIAAISMNDIHATESLLSEGADANAHISPVLLNFWQLFVNTFQHRSSSQVTDGTPLMCVFAVPRPYQDASGKYRLPPEPVAMVQLLLQKGANPNGKFSDGSSLLLMPITHKWTKCVVLMLAAGADPNATDKFGLPVMRAALLLKDTDTVQSLVQSHADVNWKDKGGKTPIQYATELHDNKMLLLLKQAGAKTAKELDVQAASAPKH